ncbi:hypothetical protein V7S43_011454 [Phytophthora oleae]|uniref:RXLR phytopathogen effector protein WY-domain domain-containing protein n=1 Tax=Phytophthora oleae TaxID=2107226 RepID=A0ABD3FAV0_9STRA
MKTDPRVVFRAFDLAKYSTKLNDNPAFFKWIGYVNKYWTTYGDSLFSEDAMLVLLLKSKPEDELVAAFHSMRSVPEMKNLADKMQTKLFMTSTSSHDAMNQVWLASRESPKEVFGILNIGKRSLKDNPMAIQWLKYIKRYRAKIGDSAFSDSEAVLFVMEATYSVQAQKFGVLLQSFKKIPDLKILAENMQTSLFRQWIDVKKLTPDELGSLMVSPHGSWKTVLRLPKSDPRFQALETYTVQYAARLNEKTMTEKVKMLFANNDPEGALAAAMKMNEA